VHEINRRPYLIPKRLRTALEHPQGPDPGVECKLCGECDSLEAHSLLNTGIDIGQKVVMGQKICTGKGMGWGCIMLSEMRTPQHITANGNSMQNIMCRWPL
jgi:hypothetical protein